jgi:hypothetical protein
VTAVKVSITFNPAHTWAGDLTATLVAPDSTQHLLFQRIGSATGTGSGDSTDLAGPYVFHDGAAGNI